MSKKERILTSLMATETELLKAAKTASKKNAANVLKNLAAIRDVCREGLSESSYVKYGEIYDGLILTVEQMTKDKKLRSNEEAFSLSGELLQYIIRETERETHFKKDIFFLPYKASMWDSLESVWKAAYEDNERCNAYVMPIPYADLTPDGSVATWHCERDQFPKYVPTLDWKEIDLKEWHPDVIFIHNPYDDFNRVTSVEHRYYSRNLKECTDKLVYIPYFVLEESCTEESVENFVLTPGVLNADKVIVQSDAMRELYINILTKRTNQADRAYWEERISGAGSPKIEKVLTSKKEDFDMPEKWRKLVDGRKVILYNTSLTAMLQNSDKVCDKLRYVFDVFRDHDDVVLWWRPHPLMKATLRSMRPEIEKKYLKIEKQYIAEGWGIYDDTPDLHRAICWSDAYYGDVSSVVQLYKVTGKRVLFQDISSSNSDSLKLHYDHIALDEKSNTVWFVTNMRHGGISKLWKMDLSSDEVHCMSTIDASCFSHKELPYSALGLIHNKIVVAPCWSNGDFFEYDILTKQSKFIPVVSEARWSGRMGRIPLCSNVVQHGDSLLFICNMNGTIVEYNGLTGKLSYHREWSDEVLKYISYNEMIFEVYSYEKYENQLYLVPYEKNIIIELDLKDFHGNVYEIPYKDRLVFIKFYNDFFWILSNKNAVVIRWNKSRNEFKRVHIPETSPQEWSYCGYSVYNNCVVIWPHRSSTIYKILINGEIDRDEYLEQHTKKEKEDSYNFVIEDRKCERTFLLRISDWRLLELNRRDDLICQHNSHIVFNDNYYAYLPQVMKEEQDILLIDFLKSENSMVDSFDCIVPAGIRILDYIIK